MRRLLLLGLAISWSAACSDGGSEAADPAGGGGPAPGGETGSVGGGGGGGEGTEGDSGAASSKLAIASVTPAQGTTRGGELVTLTGEELSVDGALPEVVFGDAKAEVKSAKPSELVVVAPARAAAGKVDVTVKTANGSATSAAAYEYVALRYSSYTRLHRYGDPGGAYLYGYTVFFDAVTQWPHPPEPVGQCVAAVYDYDFLKNTVAAKNFVRAGTDLQFASGAKTMTLAWSPNATSPGPRYGFNPNLNMPQLGQYEAGATYEMKSSAQPGGAVPALAVPGALRTPAAVAVTAPAANAKVARDAGLEVKWTTADGDYVRIDLDRDGTTVQCYARGTSFTIPTATLALFNGKPAMRMAVSNIKQTVSKLPSGTHALVEAQNWDVRQVSF